MFAMIGYALLIVAIASIWVYSKLWIWAPMLIASIVFAYFGDIIDLRALIPLALVAGCYILAARDISGFARLFTTLSAAIITIGLFTHFVAGFHNLLIHSHWRSAPDAQAINIYANYDKPFVGLLILGLYLPPVIRSRKALSTMLIRTIPWMVFTSLILLSLSQFLEMVHVDIKFPIIAPTWLILQLFFIVIPEEAFYRGFLQREITLRLNNPMAGPFAILIVSLLFALIHLLFVPHLTFIIMAFVASILYGTIYYITDRIESAILTHFFVNVVHFFCFTYPVLSNAT